MITKDKISILIKTIHELGGVLTLTYIPETTIYSTKELYELYYSGGPKMEIGKYYSTDFNNSELVTDKTIQGIIDEIYFNLQNDVSKHIENALINLELESEHLKYFKKEPELYEDFKNEVLRLKNSENGKNSL